MAGFQQLQAMLGAHASLYSTQQQRQGDSVPYGQNTHAPVAPKDLPKPASTGVPRSSSPTPLQHTHCVPSPHSRIECRVAEEASRNSPQLADKLPVNTSKPETNGQRFSRSVLPASIPLPSVPVVAPSDGRSDENKRSRVTRFNHAQAGQAQHVSSDPALNDTRSTSPLPKFSKPTQLATEKTGPPQSNAHAHTAPVRPSRSSPACAMAHPGKHLGSSAMGGYSTSNRSASYQRSHQIPGRDHIPAPTKLAASSEDLGSSNIPKNTLGRHASANSATRRENPVSDSYAARSSIGYSKCPGPSNFGGSNAPTRRHTSRITPLASLEAGQSTGKTRPHTNNETILKSSTHVAQSDNSNPRNQLSTVSPNLSIPKLKQKAHRSHNLRQELLNLKADNEAWDLVNHQNFSNINEKDLPSNSGDRKTITRAKTLRPKEREISEAVTTSNHRNAVGILAARSNLLGNSLVKPNCDRSNCNEVEAPPRGIKRSLPETGCTIISEHDSFGDGTVKVPPVRGGETSLSTEGQGQKRRRVGSVTDARCCSEKNSSDRTRVLVATHEPQSESNEQPDCNDETIVQNFVRKYGLLIVERNVNGKVQWLCCKFCPIFGCRSKGNNYIMAYMAPFSESEFESHLSAQHARHWRIFQKLSSVEKAEFLKSKRLPPPEVFRHRVTTLKLDQLYIEKRCRLYIFQESARDQLATALSNHMVCEDHSLACRWKSLSDSLSKFYRSRVQRGTGGIVNNEPGSREELDSEAVGGFPESDALYKAFNISICPEDSTDECECMKGLDCLMKPFAVSDDVCKLLEENTCPEFSLDTGEGNTDSLGIDVVNVNGEEAAHRYIMFALQDSDKAFMKIVWFYLFHGLTPGVIVRFMKGVKGLEQFDGFEVPLEVRVKKAANALYILYLSLLKNLLEKHHARNWGLTLTTRRCKDLGVSGIQFLISFLGDDYEVHRFHFVSVRNGTDVLKRVPMVLDVVCPTWRSQLIGLWSSINESDKEAKELETRTFQSLKYLTFNSFGQKIPRDQRVGKDVKLMSRNSIGQEILMLPWGLGAMHVEEFHALLQRHQTRFEKFTSLSTENAKLEWPFLNKVQKPGGKLSKWIMHSGYAEAWKSVNNYQNACVTEMLAHGLRVLWTPDKGGENVQWMGCKGDHEFDENAVDAGVERVFCARAFFELQKVSFEDNELGVINEDIPWGCDASHWNAQC